MPDLAVVVADVGDAAFPCGQDRPGVADEGDWEGRVPQEFGRRVRPRLAHDDAVVAFVREGAEVRGRQLVFMGWRRVMQIRLTLPASNS